MFLSFYLLCLLSDWLEAIFKHEENFIGLAKLFGVFQKLL